MIAKKAPKRRAGRGSFVALQEYLEHDLDDRRRIDLVASWSYGVGSHETAALEMEAVANGRRDLADPVYHVILSTRPGESLDVEQAKLAVEAVRHSLAAEQHQYFAAMHHDADTGRYHVHIGFNKVSLRGRAIDRWLDYAKLARAAEWCEREMGLQVDRHAEWRSKLGERDLSLVPEIGKHLVPVRAIAQGIDRQRRATVDRQDAVRRTHYSWVELLKQEAAPAVLLAGTQNGASWDDLHAVLRGYGVRLEAAGSGARVIGPEPGQRIKASDLGINIRTLEQHLGAFQSATFTDPAWRKRLTTAQSALWRSRSWEELHREFEAVGLAIEKTAGGGGRVLDLGDDRSAGGRHVTLGQLGPGLRVLERRLGPYELAPAVLAREERELARRAGGLRERVELLCRTPTIVLDRLAETRSVWSAADVDREVRSILGLRTGHGTLVQTAAAAVIGASVVLDRDALSLERVVAEEHAVFAAAEALAHHTRDVGLRAPSAELDAQQQAAFTYLGAERDLAIVTGIAGAGKSRLLRDAFAAYREAGYRVVGVAVAGDAARTLGHEAEIDARTVAKLIADLQSGHDRLNSRTVLVIDEAGTLGAAQSKVLFEHARDAGARVHLLGDIGQHESVGRGAVLRGLVEGYGALDMHKTRRAREEWLRDVAQDLRAGVVSRALDVLRERGAVREHATHDQAREALVQSWAQATHAGENALLVATRNDDVRAMNESAREKMRKRLGEERIYGTDFGERTFAIGEFLIGRERAHGGVNGDRYTLTAHRDDGRLELVRQRDGAKVTWDLHQHRAIDHGYATTSYRSQGRTVDAVFALASSAEARRGLYVDVTRARENVTIAYGKDEIQDFGDLLARAQRDQRKTLVRDVLRDVGFRRGVTREQEQAIEQHRAPSHDDPPQQKKGRGMRP